MVTYQTMGTDIIGRGYYNIRFSCMEDRDKVWIRSSWIIKPDLMCLQQWVPDFNPNKVRITIAQVWIRIYKLSLEY